MVEGTVMWVGQLLSKLHNEQPERMMIQGDKDSLLAAARCIREENLNYVTSPVGRGTLLLTRR